MNTKFEIAGRRIAPNLHPYIIAEVGLNHCGEVSRAIEMIRVAKMAGADAVKFQTFKATEFCGDPLQMFTYASRGREVTEPMLEMFSRFELPSSAWQQLSAEAKRIGIDFFSTPQNETDLELILPLGIPAIKVGSDDLTNINLIRNYATHKIPMILSSGMADIGEVRDALDSAGWFEGGQVSVLVCTSEYPTRYNDVNIQRVQTLRNAFPGLVVGFSDHTESDLAAIMAVALGASIFEKHFTLSHDLDGPDHWFSLEPRELERWVASIRAAFQSKGDGFVRPTSNELKMRVLARRSVVAIKDIEEGEKFSKENVGLRRPGNGIPPSYFEMVTTKNSVRALSKGSLISWEDLR